MRIILAIITSVSLLISPIAANAKCKCPGCGDSMFHGPMANEPKKSVSSSPYLGRPFHTYR